MYIQIINFNWDISEEGFDEAAIEGAPNFCQHRRINHKKYALQP